MTTLKLFIFTLILLPLCLKAQSEIEANGLLFKYKNVGDSLFCFISAPSKGWAMVGFNSENTTEKADLKFFAVKNSTTTYLDCKNIGERNYPSDNKLNGEQNIRLIEGIEKNNSSQFHFAIPLKTNDKNDFRIESDVPFYLILAYSVSDDFQHHSIMRKHFRIVIPSK